MQLPWKKLCLLLLVVCVLSAACVDGKKSKKNKRASPKTNSKVKSSEDDPEKDKSTKELSTAIPSDGNPKINLVKQNKKKSDKKGPSRETPQDIPAITETILTFDVQEVKADVPRMREVNRTVTLVRDHAVAGNCTPPDSDLGAIEAIKKNVTSLWSQVNALSQPVHIHVHGGHVSPQGHQRRGECRGRCHGDRSHKGHHQPSPGKNKAHSHHIHHKTGPDTKEDKSLKSHHGSDQKNDSHHSHGGHHSHHRHHHGHHHHHHHNDSHHNDTHSHNHTHSPDGHKHGDHSHSKQHSHKGHERSPAKCHGHGGHSPSKGHGHGGHSPSKGHGHGGHSPSKGHGHGGHSPSKGHGHGGHSPSKGHGHGGHSPSKGHGHNHTNHGHGTAMGQGHRRDRSRGEGRGHSTHIHIHVTVDEKRGGDHHATQHPHTSDVTPTDPETIYARCDLPNRNEPGQLQGYVLMRQINETLQVKVNISGFPAKVEYEEEDFDVTPMPPVKHGFHVHEFGDFSRGCASFGSHFNPDGKHHGGLDHSDRHVGDWGNLEVNSDGVAVKDFNVTDATLRGRNTIIGRGIVIHGQADDLGGGGDAGSQSTGNAGARLACCIISIVGADPSVDWPSVQH